VRLPLASQAAKLGAGEAGENPSLVEARAQAFVKLDRGSVPIEDEPLHLAATLADRNARQLNHESLACASSPFLGQNENVFDEQHRSTRECGVRNEVDCVTDGSPSTRADQRIEIAAAAESVPAQALGIEANVSHEPLVFRQLANQRNDRRDVPWSRATNS